MLKLSQVPWDAQVCILVCVTSCADSTLTGTDLMLRIKEIMLCIPNIMNITEFGRGSSMALSRIRSIKLKSIHVYG